MRIIGAEEHLSHGGIVLGPGLALSQGDDGVPVLDSSGHSVIAVLDGGGGVVSTGEKCALMIPFDATIAAVHMLGDVSGSAVVDIRKASMIGYTPPLDATYSITDATPATLVSQATSSDTDLTGWDTTINEMDVLVFWVVSCSVIKRITVTLVFE